MAISLPSIKPIITRTINDAEHFISPAAIITEVKPSLEHVSSYFSPSTPTGITQITNNGINNSVKMVKPLLYYWA